MDSRRCAVELAVLILQIGMVSGSFPFPGQIATFATPFYANGSIDYPSAAREIRAGIKAGIAGFIVPAHASEVEVELPMAFPVCPMTCVLQ